MAAIERDYRALDAVVQPSAWLGQRRAGACEFRRRRHARWRRQGQPQALARERCADDLHEPGTGRTDRIRGPAQLPAVVGTQLLWAANTTSDVLIDITNNYYYVLISGRWFDSAALTGPWTFVPSNALPPDFAHIPPQSLAGAV